MDKNTASGLTAQLQEVLKIADEYGKQSKQFAQAKKDLLELVAKVSKSNDTVVELVAQCEKYLNSAQSVIEGDYFEEIKACIKNAKEIEDELKSNNEASVARLEKLISDYEAQIAEINTYLSKVKSAFDEMQKQQAEGQAALHKAQIGTLAEIQKRIDDLFELTKEKETVIQDVVIENGEKLTPLLEQSNEKLTKALEMIGQVEADAKQFHESQQDKAEKNRESIENVITGTMSAFGERFQANEALLRKIVEETHEEQRKACRFRRFALAGLIALGVITVVLLVLRIAGV